MGRQGHKGREASIHAALDDFVTKLKRKRLGGSSLALARHTTEVLIHAVAAQQAPTAEGIIEGVRAVSKKLVEARPLGASGPQNPCHPRCSHRRLLQSHSFASKNRPSTYFPIRRQQSWSGPAGGSCTSFARAPATGEGYNAERR